MNYPLTHIIGHLLSQLETVTDVSPFWQWGNFTPFAVQYRYDAIDNEEAPLHRILLIKGVSELLKRVDDQIRQAKN
ncbi:MAG: hypothetical protein H7839_18320 [Magnetococcus sp. YQC-5]